jgi:hypothetical protein
MEQTMPVGPVSGGACRDVASHLLQEAVHAALGAGIAALPRWVELLDEAVL